MTNSSQIDFRRFISNKAYNNLSFNITTWLPTEFNVGKGIWKTVENNILKTSINGVVPIKNTNFDIDITIEKTSNNKCEVSLSGALKANGTGELYVKSNDELNIINLNFNHEQLKEITTISITRWKEVETRVSFYNVQSKLLLKEWLETWWV